MARKKTFFHFLHFKICRLKCVRVLPSRSANATYMCMFLPRLFLILFASALYSSCAASSDDSNTRPHVCIVGGGIAGAAAAHYLQDSASLTLFESAPRVGGRIASARLAPDLLVEAGASVLAAENTLFGELAAGLGLARKAPAAGARPPRLGLWDGRAFRYRSTGRFWTDAPGMLWRYGRPLLRMRKYVSALLTNFDGLYVGADAGHETVADLLARAPGLYALTQQPFSKSAAAAFGGGPLVEELISAVSCE